MMYGRVFEEPNNEDFEVLIDVPFDEIIIEGQHIDKVDLYGTDPAKKDHVYVAFGQSSHGKSGRVKIGTGTATNPPNFKDYTQFGEYIFKNGVIKQDNNSKKTHTPTKREKAVADAIGARYMAVIACNANGSIDDDTLGDIIYADRPNLGTNRQIVPVNTPSGSTWYADYKPSMGEITKIKGIQDTNPNAIYPPLKEKRKKK